MATPALTLSRGADCAEINKILEIPEDQDLLCLIVVESVCRLPFQLIVSSEGFSL